MHRSVPVRLLTLAVATASLAAVPLAAPASALASSVACAKETSPPIAKSGGTLALFSLAEGSL